MSHFIARLSLVAPFLLLGACSTTPETSVVVQDDADCPLNLQTGQTLIVSLPSNPTTGNRWVMRDAAPDQLESLGPEVFSTPNAEVIGGKGISTWRFEAQASGSGRLYLTYQRPWEAETEPAGLFDCRVEVD